MTLDQVIESYNAIITDETVKLSKLKAQIFRIGSVRLIIVLACFILCYLLWGNNLLFFTNIFVSLVLFLGLMKYHNRLYITKTYCEQKIKNATNELKGIDYDFSAFDGAAEKIDGNHRFSLDLDLFGKRSFFQSVNRTVSKYGKDKLADTFLQPYETKEPILKQQGAIKELASKPQLAAHFRACGQMSEIEDFDIKNLDILNKGKQLHQNVIWKIQLWFIPIVSLIGIVSLIFDFISSGTFILLWIVLMIFSSLPLKDIRKKLNVFEKKADALERYASLFKIIEAEKFNSELLHEIQQKIKEDKTASASISKLKYLLSNLDQSFNIIGLFFLNPFGAWDINYCMKLEKWVENNNGNIGEWFKALADFDSLVSLSIFAYNHPDYCYPEIEEHFVFEGKDLGHPMISRNVCVRNDISIEQNPYFLVVTGANMAGKSTYLRTIGINHTLACIGVPVCAISLKIHPFRLVTNLRTSDSLNDNESYFFAELKRLKMIIDRLQAGERLFIILDEILKGTNSEDKQKGSIALMKQLVALNGNGIIATHDLALGELEKEFPSAIKNYRFEADIRDEHLSFSYKIREGVAQNMNACFLMKQMGITGL